MPTFPEENTHTTSSAKYDISFNPNGPIVHGLNSSVLEKNGWVRNGTTYTKEGKEVKYDGVYWWHDGEKIYFLEDIAKKNSDTRPE